MQIWDVGEFIVDRVRTLEGGSNRRVDNTEF
jgi:hypothetical protein